MGYFAGRYSTESNILLVHNAQLVNAATEKTNSMFYGQFSNTLSSQELQINGVFTIHNDKSGDIFIVNNDSSDVHTVNNDGAVTAATLPSNI